jgi:hypothetical protein
VLCSAMAPKNIDIAGAERESISMDLDMIEAQVTGHTAMPLSEEAVGIILETLEKLRNQLSDINKRIILCAPADIDDHKRLYCNLTMHLFKLMTDLQIIKKTFTAGSSHPPPPPIVPTTDIRLPTLEIPSLDGNVMDWPSFRDMFKSIVDNNTRLSKAQKLAHLKTSVTGEASRLIRALNLTDGNYDIAWKQLNDRYQNERELLFHIYRRLHGQPNAAINSSSSIRSLIDISKECIRSLEVLSIFRKPELDSILLFIIFGKMDLGSKELWEQSLKDSKIPSLDSLFEFLEQRARSLGAGGTSRGQGEHANKREDKQSRVQVHLSQESESCKVCKKDNHPLYKCAVLLAQTVSVRKETVRKLQLCYNCLHRGHSSRNCSSEGRCKTCKGGHNSLFHESKDAKEGNHPSSEPQSFSQQIHAVEDKPSLARTMLATAMVRVITHDGNELLCRAFLDGGSTHSLITESCVQRLGLRRMKCAAEITGLQSSTLATARGITSIIITPHFSKSIQITVSALIIPKVTDNLPVYSCKSDGWTHLKGIRLADPSFGKPAPIDILLGSDVFWDILLDGKRSGPAGSAQLINSEFGWLVAGTIKSKPPQVRVHYTEADLDVQLQQFWELESHPATRVHTLEEENPEQHFKDNVTRDEDGRYHIKLPLKDPSLEMGDSRTAAVRRFNQLERRLPRTPRDQERYLSCIQEYLDSHHMELIPAAEVSNPIHPVYYIPHHYVVKEESSTTKLRVVFDASAKSTSKVSLNGNLMVGPVQQDNLIDIMIRFRLHVIAFTADIARMYRQIKVSASDKDLQRILWRDHPGQNVREYRLTTVTFGTAAAPYLATRVLRQLAEDERSSFPLASKVVSEDFYVDDMLSGADSVADAIILQNQLLSMMSRGCFSLRKWSSNSAELLQRLPMDMVETSPTGKIDFNNNNNNIALLSKSTTW